MLFFHNFFDIWLHLLSNCHEFFKNWVCFFSVTPDFIFSYTMTLSATRCPNWILHWCSVTMDTEHRRKCAILEPTYHTFSKRWIGRDSTMEATDIGCPPRDSSNRHVEPCSHLFIQRLKARWNIT